MLDQLRAIKSGANPDAGHNPLPDGLASALNLARVGMFGHSLGAADADAMAADQRILAGIDLDGSIVNNLPAPGDQAALLQVKQLARGTRARSATGRS